MQLTPAQLELEKLLCDRYCLKQKLGENTSYQIWLAGDLQATNSENCQVIIKLLCFGGQNQWEQLALLEREAQILKQLDYPYIPKYRDYFWIDDRFLWFGLVQDYIPGTSLEDLLAEGKKFTESQIRQMAIDLLNILVYLHELDPPLLHQNIKPSNLIWSQDEQLYLVDFGIQDKRGALTVVGTYGYTPMEQFGSRMVPASDLYALGATLIHVLTGVHPADLPQKDLRIQFRDRVYAHPILIAWIEKLTEPDVARRFSSARDAITSLMADFSLSSAQIERHKLLLPLLPETTAKPLYTRVQLIQAPHQLKVQIPMQGIKNLTDVWRALGCTGILALFCLIFLLKDEFLTVLFLVILFAPFGIPVVILIGFLVRNARRFFTKNLLIIDRQKIEIKQQFFGLTYRQFKNLTPSIQDISINSTSWSSLSTSIAITFSSHPKRYTRYLFGSSLSEAELTWLVEEIRKWLQTVSN